MTQLKDTKIAQHFSVPMFRLIWQILLAIVAVIGMYYALVGSIGANAQNIEHNTETITDNKKVFDKHIEDVKNDPISEAEMKLMVVANTAVNVLTTAELKRVSDLQIGVMTNQDNIVDDVGEIQEDMNTLQKDVSNINANVQILLDRTIERYPNDN